MNSFWEPLFDLGQLRAVLNRGSCYYSVSSWWRKLILMLEGALPDCETHSEECCADLLVHFRASLCICWRCLCVWHRGHTPHMFRPHELGLFTELQWCEEWLKGNPRRDKSWVKKFVLWSDECSWVMGVQGCVWAQHPLGHRAVLGLLHDRAKECKNGELCSA